LLSCVAHKSSLLCCFSCSVTNPKGEESEKDRVVENISHTRVVHLKANAAKKVEIYNNA
jgi:hypothetical protein